ncbi:hypothetical protein THIOM_000156 [Candidatus Thiomargarita nelsonii]|uniref:Uncharacterized protein n=1 Tax=Candidatus Thiomargarita nelsonii TaxID=1003181 RepID=A0A176S7D9_9GAMM|nr:hypothetical protein THIOM_000156 [Candidatus Thiomargarita nelsonii]
MPLPKTFNHYLFLSPLLIAQKDAAHPACAQKPHNGISAYIMQGIMWITLYRGLQIG